MPEPVEGLESDPVLLDRLEAILESARARAQRGDHGQAKEEPSDEAGQLAKHDTGGVGYIEPEHSKPKRGKISRMKLCVAVSGALAICLIAIFLLLPSDTAVYSR